MPARDVHVVFMKLYVEIRIGFLKNSPEQKIIVIILRTVDVKQLTALPIEWIKSVYKMKKVKQPFAKMFTKPNGSYITYNKLLFEFEIERRNPIFISNLMTWNESVHLCNSTSWHCDTKWASGKNGGTIKFTLISRNEWFPKSVIRFKHHGGMCSCVLFHGNIADIDVQSFHDRLYRLRTHVIWSYDTY